MRKEYDFSNSRKNPYARQLKKQITIRLDTVAVTYFNEMAGGNGDALSEPDQPVFEGLRSTETPPEYSMAGGRFVEAARSAPRAMTGGQPLLPDFNRPLTGRRCPLPGSECN
jgi:hypothetical protein